MGSASPAMKPDVTLTLCLSSPDHFEAINPEERGILLIQMLLKCAMNASSGNLHRADACLHQISHHASISGDSMQRLAARFASALAVRLVKRWPGLYKALNRNPSWQPKADWAGPIFGKVFPHLELAYTIIAQTLTRTMAEERVIHILDTGSGDPEFSNKLALEKLGIRLVKEAEALAMPFQFNPLNVTLRDLTIDMLRVRSGEALAITSVLNLHTLLAEDDRVDAHFGLNKGNIVKEYRFVQGLYYYSAIFDSMNATLGSSSSEERLAVEEMYGREIENIVACEGLERVERHESYGRWMVRLGRGGFKPVRLWYESMEGVKDLVGGDGEDGYKVRNERASLMICWSQRPLYAISAWICQ
ncbi:Scarecrow-like protein 3 [Vitis vinifera]|uniref:Scarecrow-like protein 3 n=1 Tax=Vitis vinifera TaxID=29760 RepID=A0A438IMW1_VITVI|nr:Scarecrow-like protein 3 [Vitis vinifera]